MMRLNPWGVAIAALMLAGCGTSAFKAPVWTASSSTASRTDVGSFLRQHVETYDRMIADLEAGKTVLEAPIIPAAVVGATGVALGAGTNLPIVLGGGAAGLSAGSAYLRPRDRLALVVQARAAAVCINTQFNDQARTAIAGGYLVELSGPAEPQLAAVAEETQQQKQSRERENQRRAVVAARNRGISTALGLTDELGSLGSVGVQVYDLGGIAVDAAEEVVTRLKLRLANIGSAPDYGAIVTDLRQRFDTAEEQTADTVASLVTAKKALTTADEVRIKRLSEYSARVAECVAKIP